MFVPLSELGKVSLGFKSLQNSFYYVNEATINTYGIESKYLTPILMRRAMDPRAYFQAPAPTQWLLNCRDKKGDLRGTGALKYIEAMADRSAAKKKQSGKSQTIREALEAQGGGLWYAPKARTNQHHIWLRKAIDGVFSPYLFPKLALVDQRLNSVAPHKDIKWKELAAVLTSTLFSYSVEINGSASMGAGALEAPTTKLQSYPVFDLRELSVKDRGELTNLAESVWKNEPPLDWSQDKVGPGKHLIALDKWLLEKAGSSVPVEKLYADLHEVCGCRIAVAKDKNKKTKKKTSDNIRSVAESICSSIKAKIQARSFPDDFADGVKLDVSFNFDRKSLKSISIHQMMDRYEIIISTRTGEIAYEGDHVRSVAEAIIRSLLWGRSIFSISDDKTSMETAVSAFISWMSQIDNEINKLILESALGTGYEDALKQAVYSQLGVHPLAGARDLPSEISLAALV